MIIKFATTNKAKVLSLQEAFLGQEVIIEQLALDLPEPRSDQVEVIAATKVNFAFHRINQPVVALDAGFFIDGLGGFPRAFVNFALETIGLKGILKLVEGQDSACEFRHALAYLDTTLSEPKVFIDHVRGTLAPEPRGQPRPRDWSVLSQVFIPEGKMQSLTEMSDKDYTQWRDKELLSRSYRHAFVDWLRTHSSAQVIQ